ncbi:hypothetical protein L198_06459 [Cryptococcus wingfieldii CBS 7118]|uniref:E3 ubiquitin-protein ligase n=1 Tax=Cryptococcus wingfieldii CBS 7118 TaxID=1295528 RepID=A0A1E3IKL2_9TREE|nr:hypothetical protein L198_06459 [Cryptococcus wingfieldii CBS 7118]ODN89140.1 hypothetical protein L198_06459 [Cryptococcus wingfieldii CBS 7118]
MGFVEVVGKFVFGGGDKASCERMKLMMSEWPLQKHVVFAQSRANMWKKNGSALRLQHHHYCDVSVRDSTIDQALFLALFLLQVSLCVVYPLELMIACIDRFGLGDYFQDSVTDPTLWYDENLEPKQKINLLEDFLLLVIQLATYPVFINSWDRYTEIETPRKITGDQLLAHLVGGGQLQEPDRECPWTVQCLKDEMYNEVDPYWKYYSRNDQPFSTTADFLGTHVVADIVHWAFAHSMHIATLEQWADAVQSAFPQDHTSSPVIPTWDLVLDYALHLSMLALSVKAQEFAQQSVYLKGSEGTNSTFQKLWVMQSDAAFQPFRARVDYILDTIVANIPPHYTADYRAHKESENPIALSRPAKPDSKASAAARQKAIMAKCATGGRTSW